MNWEVIYKIRKTGEKIKVGLSGISKNHFFNIWLPLYKNNLSIEVIHYDYENN